MNGANERRQTAPTAQRAANGAKRRQETFRTSPGDFQHCALVVGSMRKVDTYEETRTRPLPTTAAYSAELKGMTEAEYNQK